jgi:hypothetical protein
VWRDVGPRQTNALPRIKLRRAAAHLVVRTDTGLYEHLIARPGSAEFTLPTHERVVSAWIDAVGGPDGALQACTPSGAFFVDGFHSSAFAKQYLLGKGPSASGSPTRPRCR